VDYDYVIRETLDLIPKPKDGQDAVIDYKKVINEVLSKIPKPKDGVSPKVDIDYIIKSVRSQVRDGLDASVEETAQKVLESIVIPDETGETIIDKINEDTDKTIKSERIAGLKNFNDEIATLQNRTQLLNQIASGAIRRIDLLEADDILDNSKFLTLDQTTPQTVTGTPTFPVLRTPKIYPSADSTTAVGIFKADGTTNVLNVDTTNSRLGIGTTEPTYKLDVWGTGTNGSETEFRIVNPSTGEAAASRLVFASGAGQERAAIEGSRIPAGGAGWLSFYTQTSGSGLTEKMRIDTAGNIGIGTTAPGQKLDVQGTISSAPTIRVLGNDTASYALTQVGTNYVVNGNTSGVGARIVLGDVGTGGKRWDLTSGGEASGAFTIRNNTDAVNALTILSTGNVGIGTTAPSSLLHLKSATVPAVIYMEGLSTGSGSQGLLVRTPTGTNRMSWIQYGSDHASQANNVKFANYGNGWIQFAASETGMGNDLVIASDGKVGVGTSAPGAALHISSANFPQFQDRFAGSTATASAGIVGRKARGTQASPTAALSGDHLVNIIGNGYTSAGAFSTVNTAKMGFYAAENFTAAAQGTHIVFETTPTGTVTPTERLRITSQGNVGIGETTPTAYLHLKAGTATASTAPLKFTSGTLNTTAEAGTVEYLTDNLHFTIATGTARKGIVLDDGTRLTSGKIPVATTNGRLIDLTAQAAEADLKTDYTAGDLDTEAEIITAINATNTKINAIIAKLETLGLLAS
jgi:hypothetical protein